MGELGRFQPNVNVTDVMGKIARVGGNEQNLFSLCSIEEGTAGLKTGRTQCKDHISVSSSIYYCIHVQTRV